MFIMKKMYEEHNTKRNLYCPGRCEGFLQKSVTVDMVEEKDTRSLCRTVMSLHEGQETEMSQSGHRSSRLMCICTKNLFSPFLYK